MISVVIPSYNSEKYISESIQSVISQTYQDWELIIVDDGSTDQSAIIIINFCANDSRIKYLYQNNSGVSRARNIGISLATGELIALLDADDVWNNNKLEVVVKAFKENIIDWSFSNVLEFQENGDAYAKELSQSNNYLKSLLLWDGKILTAPSGIVFKKSCFIQGLSFDEQFSTAADQDFAIQLASKYKGYHIPEILWRYRVLENSMCRSIELMEKDHLAVYQKARNNKLFPTFLFKQRCFSNLYWILAGSWWVNGNNKKRALLFIAKALIANPLSFIKIIRKI